MKYTLNTGDILAQIDIVSGWKEGAIRMPRNIERFLDQAITARKRFTTWFQRTDNLEHSRFSNEKHRYFIDLLQKVADTFKGESQEGETAKKSTTSAAEVDVMRNYFSLSPAAT